MTKESIGLGMAMGCGLTPLLAIGAALACFQADRWSEHAAGAALAAVCVASIAQAWIGFQWAVGRTWNGTLR